MSYIVSNRILFTLRNMSHFQRHFVALAFEHGEVEFFSAIEFLRERTAFLRYLEPLRQKDWNVCAKTPVGGHRQIFEYGGLYARRISCYGLLSNRHRREKLEQCRRLLGIGRVASIESHGAASADYRHRYEALSGPGRRAVAEGIETEAETLAGPMPLHVPRRFAAESDRSDTSFTRSGMAASGYSRPGPTRSG